MPVISARMACQPDDLSNILRTASAPEMRTMSRATHRSSNHLLGFFCCLHVSFVVSMFLLLSPCFFFLGCISLVVLRRQWNPDSRVQHFQDAPSRSIRNRTRTHFLFTLRATSPVSYFTMVIGLWYDLRLVHWSK